MSPAASHSCYRNLRAASLRLAERHSGKFLRNSFYRRPWTSTVCDLPVHSTLISKVVSLLDLSLVRPLKRNRALYLSRTKGFTQNDLSKRNFEADSAWQTAKTNFRAMRWFEWNLPRCEVAGTKLASRKPAVSLYYSGY